MTVNVATAEEAAWGGGRSTTSRGSVSTASRVDPEIVAIVKAASLVEYNGGAYAHHLCRVFHDDPAFQASARRWGEEEIQHGEALGRWAALADPDFDFAAAFARFQTGYQVDFDCEASRRGSRAGEMVARCIVETGDQLLLRGAARRGCRSRC